MDDAGGSQDAGLGFSWNLQSSSAEVCNTIGGLNSYRCFYFIIVIILLLLLLLYIYIYIYFFFFFWEGGGSCDIYSL